MEEKLREILEKNQSRIDDLNFEIERLVYAINLYSQHGFNEEMRVAQTKKEAMERFSIPYKLMHEEITELLNKWES